MAQRETSAEPADSSAPSDRRGILVAGLAWAAAVPVLSSLIPARARAATGTGPAVVNMVTFEVPAEGMSRFLQICKTNSQASLKEPGVTGFEVLLAKDDPNVVILIETYRNQAGYEAHRVTPHFKAFVRGMQEIGATRTARVATRYYPE
ncbi:MAG TPA: putative quinol monooxygenase [Caulobacteraceae bacterium]|jgi:quinol monooxygenase YgiN